jgi:putative heme-binding domain-containing protein
VLVSRLEWAKSLVDAIDKKYIPASDLSAYQARQVQGFNNAELSAALEKAWGTLRTSPAEKQAIIDGWKKKLTPDAIAKGDARQGRLLFKNTCAVCHTLYDDGGKIGPNLTGSGRADLDYVLYNVIDPSAVVAVDYRLSIVTMKDGRVLAGFLRDANDKTVTVQTITDAVTVEKAEIKSTQATPSSLMPDGLLQTMSDEQVRNLVKYLASPSQVPLP